MDNLNTTDQTVDVLYDFTEDGEVAGFQFDVSGFALTGASGGVASEVGFQVSTGASTVLGFSFTGSTIPGGCGTLTQMTLSGDATGLSGIVFSDESGTQFDVSYFDGSGDDGGDDLVHERSEECQHNLILTILMRVRLGLNFPHFLCFGVGLALET